MITIHIDTKRFEEGMLEFERNQMPFATKNGLNYTALDFQKAERARIAQTFILRRPTFILNTVKIERGDFATKEKLEVTIRIDPTRHQLAKFEQGGTKEGLFGAHAVAIPIEARRSKYDIVTSPNRPKAFHLQTISLAHGHLVAKGQKRTFLIQNADGSGGIYQRVGRGRSSTIKLLFALKDRVPIPRGLNFETTARAIVEDRFPRNFEIAFADAMRTAR